MTELYEIMQQEWAIRALLASSMVGIMCGVLGCFIVLRNMALIGDALAHAVLPGVVLGYMIAGYSLMGFFTGAVAAGLVAAVSITWIQHNVKTKNDAAIGIVFTAMFSLGVMGISSISREQGVHLDLKDFLFGNTLGVSNGDLYLTGAITLYVLFSVVVFYRYLFASTFQPIIAETMGISVKAIHYFLMLLLSFAVVASLQTVGVILVVAMLITPASTALLLSNRLERVLVISAIVGLLSAVIGLLLAIWAETTPGPAMAIVATVLYLLAVFFAPEKGLLFVYFRKWKIQRKIRFEDTLKQSLKLHEKGELSLENLQARLGFGKSLVDNNLNRLASEGFIKRDKGTLVMTEEGIAQANRLVRAHRLWETYLVDQMGLDESQIHDDAERYEHILTDELLDEMEAKLGYPNVDPHGAPIPETTQKPNFALSQLAALQTAIITKQQLNEHISAELWKLGLLHDISFSVKALKEEVMEISFQEGEVIVVPLRLAKKVQVVAD